MVAGGLARSSRTHPAGGKGAATFEIARRGIRVGSIVTTEPHDLPLQFLAETGIVGLLLLLGLVGSAATVAIRSALRRAEPAERAAATALAIGVGAFAVHSLVDIHWDFVAVGAPAFFSLGVLLGLGAERGRAGRSSPSSSRSSPSARSTRSRRRTRPAGSSTPPTTRSRTGNVAAAVSDGRSARWLNPLAVDPLLALGDAEASAARRGGRAPVRYRQAVALQPENSSTWYALGSYEFFTGRYRAALHDLDRAYGLDPYGPAGRPGGLLDQARAKVEGR